MGRQTTKFPVARIKKIMQMDEEVGKVAQAVPVIVSKALEMFMQSLIDETSKETRLRNAKKMSMAHLKRTICTVEQFDFLKDLVAKVPDSGPAADASTATPASATPATRTRRSKNASPAKATRALKSSAAYPQHQSVFASASSSGTASPNNNAGTSPIPSPAIPPPAHGPLLAASYKSSYTAKKEEEEDDDYDMEAEEGRRDFYSKEFDDPDAPLSKRVKHESSPSEMPKAHSMPKGPGGVNIFGDDIEVKAESGR